MKRKHLVYAAVRFALIGMIAVVVLSSCVEKPAEPIASTVPEGYSLVWADEFDSDGAPNPDKWDYSVGGNGWGNGELQVYTNTRENSFVKDGALNITALNNKGSWTSARLKTLYKADWTYGYIEARARVPEGVGTWPAIWMMPRGDIYGNWPRSGEIDIMEHVGFDPEVIHTTAHTLAYYHKIGTQKTMSAKVKGVTKGYHTYAVRWDPDYIEWYVDGKAFFRFENEKKTFAEWPFDHPFYLILNVAIGGSWGGTKGIDPKLKKATMLVDYVRVYQK
jgi:beta-glucanase (GH16 family)